MASHSRKSVAIALGVLGLAGLSLASAAQLGVTSQSLGAGTTLVASCDADGITARFVNTYDPATKRYNATQITLSGVATTCNNATVQVTVADTSGASLGVASGTANSTGSVTLPLSPAVNSNVATDIAVVIAG